MWEINTVPNTNVKGVSLLAGVGGTDNNSTGQLSFGGYAEIALGSYDSEHTFKQQKIATEGNTKHYGVGAALQQNFDNNVIIKGGVRIGNSITDYASKDILYDSKPTTIKFKTKRRYTSAYAGVGYDVKVNDTMSITPYANVHYTNYGKADVTIKGQQFKLDLACLGA